MSQRREYWRLCPDIPKADYEAFKGALAEEIALPATHEEWLSAQRGRERQVLFESGMPTKWVSVDFNRFDGYCRAINIRPSMGALASLCAALVTSKKVPSS